MSKLLWDQDQERLYETGVEQCALFLYDPTNDSATDSGYLNGVAWNGVTGITESPSGAENTALWANDKKYLTLQSIEEFGGTIEAYMYPDEFMVCDGSANLGGIAGVTIGQQPRKKFGLVYKTKLGNDDKGTDFGYKLHIIYGCQASVSERAYSTVNDSPEAITFSWSFETTPVNFLINDVEYSTSSIIIDSSKFTSSTLKAKLTALEETLYGSDGSEAKTSTLPTPDDVYDALKTTI